MTVSLDDLKTSLRIDGEADDMLLKAYQTAAQSYVKNAIGTEDDSFYENEDVSTLYDVAVIALASGYYSFRTSFSYVQAFPVDIATNSIISQLRGIYADFMAGKGVYDADKST